MERKMRHGGIGGVRLAWAMAGLACFTGAASLAGTFRQMAAVQDAAGSLSTNRVTLPADSTAYRHLGASGQAGGVQTSTNGGFTLQAGFLHAADIKRPSADHDRDGVPDEVSADNDGDGLSDKDEIAGARFGPTTPTDVNQADSDGDGAKDGDEASAATNPLDTNSLLRVLSMRALPGQWILS